MRKQNEPIIKYCAYCGRKLERKRFNGRIEDYQVFAKRKYCNQLCMGMDYKERAKHGTVQKD